MLFPDFSSVCSRGCGRHSFFPFCQAWAKPARTCSRRISLSNSAKIASKPAIGWARLVRFTASVSETKPKLYDRPAGRTGNSAPAATLSLTAPGFFGSGILRRPIAPSAEHNASAALP